MKTNTLAVETIASEATPESLRRATFKSLRLWVGIAFSLVFLALALRNINLRASLDLISQVNLIYLGLAMVSFILSVIAKSARWQVLLSTHKAPTFGRTFSLFSVGQMINTFLPGPLGEVGRSYLMGEAEADSKVYVLGTVIVERIADLVFLLLSILYLLSRITLPDWLASPARATEMALLVFVPIFALVVWQKDLLLRFLVWAVRFAPRGWRDWIVREAHFALDSLDSVRRPRLLLGLVLWSFIIFFLSALTNYLVFLAFGLALPFGAALLLLVVLQVGTQIPSSPGGVGIFQYLCILTLSFFGVDRNLGLGFGILLTLVVSVPIVLIGGISLWHEKITWDELRKAATILSRLKNKTRSKPS